MMDNILVGWAPPTILVRNDANGGRCPLCVSTLCPSVLILSVLFAALLGAHAIGGAANDDCAQAEAISGEGMFAFDNAAATTDGPAHQGCRFWFGLDIVSDVWYCWTATCDGPVTVDTCQGTTVDTRLAVYDGCDCPPTHANLLACNDDASDLAYQCGYQSSTTFEAQAGQSYLVRIGVHPGLGGGSGEFTITCGGPVEPPCSHSGDNCENRDRWNAYNSNRTNFVVADDFTAESDGAVAELCWWGAYFDGSAECRLGGTDTFEVRYYADADGLPGGLLAGPFSQADGTLTVAGPARTGGLITEFLREYEYAATHDPVQVVAGQCYWIEISNLGSDSCAWFWESAGPGSHWALQTAAADPPNYAATDAIPDDLAFCFDIVQGDSTPCLMPPINDDCPNSLQIFDGETSFDTTGATTDGSNEPVCEFTFADPRINQDIWFDYTAPPPCNGIVTVTLCDSLYDTKMAVYEGSDCPAAGDPLACNDDASELVYQCSSDWLVGSHLSFPVEIGQSYKLRVGGFGNSAGLGTILLALDQPDCNDNGVPDECDILAGNSMDCDYNYIPDECETDCNNNGLLDECDIDGETSEDCNNNGVPDECDTDCNENATPDECDIADGSSEDGNGNGVPDECECLVGEFAKLTASDAEEGERFGLSVAISGEAAVLGAPFASGAGLWSGAAYVYRFDGANWIEETELTASDARSYSLFGDAVSVDGDAAVIGAPTFDGSESGAAYVYRFDGSDWGDEIKLTAPEPEEWDRFGVSVSVDGELVVVGAPQDAAEGPTGSAYVYRFDGTNWIEEAVIVPYWSVQGGSFGTSVCVNGNVVLIGSDAPENGRVCPLEPLLGSVYAFRFNGTEWVQDAILVASDGVEDDWFGTSVSINGNVALVGAPGPRFNSNFIGAAYVFRFDGSSWVEEARLVPADAEHGDRFGVSVSLRGDMAVIGAEGDEDSGIGSGSAYVYRFDGVNWIEQAKLIPSDPEHADAFGASVSLSGDRALIGSPQDGDVGSRSGAAYVFGGLSDCNENGIFDACEPGDFDGDGHVDLVDFAQWADCVTGPENGPVAGCCTLFDFDADQDVDHRDFAGFQTALTGQ